MKPILFVINHQYFEKAPKHVRLFHLHELVNGWLYKGIEGMVSALSLTSLDEVK